MTPADYAMTAIAFGCYIAVRWTEREEVESAGATGFLLCMMYMAFRLGATFG